MKISPYQSAFDEFKGRFLDEGKSIFSGKEILDPTNIRILRLIVAENDNALEGNASFIEKLKAQTEIGVDSEKPDFPSKAVKNLTLEQKNNALELLAHAVWLWRLPPFSTNNKSSESRKNAVKEILDLIDPKKAEELIKYAEGNGFFKDFSGFASPGMYYYTNKHNELNYIISFFERYRNLEDKNEVISFLNNKDAEDRIKAETIQANSTLNKDGVINKNPSNKKFIPKEVTCSMQNALLHLLDSDNYEPILSNAHKKMLVKNLEHTLTPEEKDENNIDRKVSSIRGKLTKLFSFPTDEFSFYSKTIRPLWDDNLQPIEINTIYYGPPGTGKTYLARQAIEARTVKELFLESNETKLENEGIEAIIKKRKRDRIKQVQFHPSFTYEDFIDGLKPELVKGQVNLKLTNGTFKNFCCKATKELKEFRVSQGETGKDDSRMPMFYFITDEINRADLSSVLGEVLSCLEEDKRLDFDEKGSVTENSLLIQTKNAYLQTNDVNNPAVFTEDNQTYFGIPKNLVFVGTMNDIDRSVDTFDFALRRRFTWIYKGFDIEAFADAEAFKAIEAEALEEYAQSCKALNDFIFDEPSLGESYAIGHAYFFNIELSTQKPFNKSNKGRLFDRHLAPLLEEYLRASFSSKDIKAKVAEAKIIFTS